MSNTEITKTYANEHQFDFAQTQKGGSV